MGLKNILFNFKNILLFNFILLFGNLIVLSGCHHKKDVSNAVPKENSYSGSELIPFKFTWINDLYQPYFLHFEPEPIENCNVGNSYECFFYVALSNTTIKLYKNKGCIGTPDTSHSGALVGKCYTVNTPFSPNTKSNCMFEDELVKSFCFGNRGYYTYLITSPTLPITCSPSPSGYFPIGYKCTEEVAKTEDDSGGPIGDSRCYRC